MTRLPWFRAAALAVLMSGCILTAAVAADSGWTDSLESIQRQLDMLIWDFEVADWWATENEIGE